MSVVYPKRELMSEAFAGQKEVIKRLTSVGHSQTTQPMGYNRIKRKAYKPGYNGGYMNNYNNYSNYNNNNNNNNNIKNSHNTSNNFNPYQSNSSRNDDPYYCGQIFNNFQNLNVQLAISTIPNGQYGSQLLVNPFVYEPSQICTNKYGSSNIDSSTNSTPTLSKDPLLLDSNSSSSTINNDTSLFSEKFTPGSKYQFDPFKPLNLSNKFDLNLSNFDNLNTTNSIWNNNTVWG